MLLRFATSKYYRLLHPTIFSHAPFSVLGYDIVLLVPSFTHRLHLSSRILSKDSRHIPFPIVSQYEIKYMCEKPR